MGISQGVLWEHTQDGIPRQLTLVGQRPREAMERLSLMQFARVRLRETAAQPAEEALGRLPLAKTRVWKPDHDRALLMVRLTSRAHVPPRHPLKRFADSLPLL